VEAALRAPWGLAADSRGEKLYVADSGNHGIRQINLDTGVIITAAGSVAGYAGDGGPSTEARLNTPVAAALTPDHAALLIADRNSHRVRRVDLVRARIVTLAGSGQQAFRSHQVEAAAAGLSMPNGLAVDGFGFLYLADTGHHIVRRMLVPGARPP
jgi:sugar lactone lactonase YvrE